MSTKRFTIDALSRALCPSIDAALLVKATSSPLPSVSSGHTAHSVRPCRPSHVQARLTHTTAHDSTAGQPPHQPIQVPLSVPRGSIWTRPARPDRRSPPGSGTIRRHAIAPMSERLPGIPRSQLAEGRQSRTANRAGLPEVPLNSRFPPRPALPDWVAEAPTSTIYEKLRQMRNSPDNGGSIRAIVKYLVKERGEPPNVFMYEALVVANWDTTQGSAGELAAMIKEMKTAGVGRSQGFYHSALRLLAIHPDYLLRNTLLREMGEAGVDLSADGKCSVVLGLLRDGQSEMALEYWDQLHQEKTPIPTWVSETFIYVLAMRGFVGEAFQAFRQTLDDTGEGDTGSASLGLWYYLLDECSRAFEYEGTSFIWKQMVLPGTINPSDGMLLNVLNTAARHGDPTLATAALELLSKRDVTLRAHHYEPLIESYVEAGDMENTFRVLCIMADSVLNVGRSSTRSIFLRLKRAPALVDEAVRVLNSLGKEHNVPVIAVRVVLEALLSAGAGFSRTLGVYHRICEICKSGPGAATMLMLLEACDNAESAVLLVQEMDRFSIPPSPELVDHLIRCFAHDGSLDVALLYFDEMSGLASSPGVSQRTADKVLGRCVAEKDPRAFKVAEEAIRRGRTVRPDILAGLDQMKKELGYAPASTAPSSGSAEEEGV